MNAELASNVEIAEVPAARSLRLSLTWVLVTAVAVAIAIAIAVALAIAVAATAIFAAVVLVELSFNAENLVAELNTVVLVLVLSLMMVVKKLTAL